MARCGGVVAGETHSAHLRTCERRQWPTLLSINDETSRQSAHHHSSRRGSARANVLPLRPIRIRRHVEGGVGSDGGRGLSASTCRRRKKKQTVYWSLSWQGRLLFTSIEQAIHPSHPPAAGHRCSRSVIPS